MRLRTALVPISWLTGCLVAVRNEAYSRGWMRIESAGVPVISVGNVTVGGTGKTPLVEYVARFLGGRGVKVAVVSRGYRRASRGLRVVSDGRRVFLTPAESGDEPAQVAGNVPGAVVVVDAQRARGARHAVRSLGAQAVVLDDGFQHRAVARDLDIVAMNAKEHPGALIPAGRGREPLSGLRRAHAIVWTHCDGPEEVKRLADRMRAYTDAPMFCTHYEVVEIREAPSGEAVPVERIKGARIVAFCGIGNPRSFRRTLEDLRVSVVSFVAFPDHHDYRPRDLARLRRAQAEADASWLLTTQKDAVRLRSNPEALRLHYPVIRPRFLYGEEIFHRMLEGIVDAAQQ